MQIHNGVGDERPQFFSGSQITFVHVAKTDRPCAKRLEDSVVLEHLGLEFFREHHWLHQIGHAEAGTRRLVCVSRADAAFGCSDLAPTQLALFIEQTVVGQNQMRAIANEQIPPDRDSQLAQAIDLGDERDRIDHHAIADHANFSAP